MINFLKNQLTDLKQLRKSINNENVSQISKKGIREKAELLGSLWFSESSKINFEQFEIKPEIVEKYDDKFNELIKISSPSNLKSSYIIILNSLIKEFRSDLILPLHRTPQISSSLRLLDPIINNISNPEENIYIKESIECAKAGFKRASVVLGWCASIDKIHKKIESLGFTAFNITSANLASQTKGRFKKFSQTQNVNSISELREVFDTVILWIIEGMGLIDSNQHTRLRSCFELRCQCSHPGDAPITEFNLMSYFSDLNEIVFRNDKFN